jgi:hypothetical protein
MLLISGLGRFELAAEQLAHTEEAKGQVILPQVVNILCCEQGFRPLTGSERTSQHAQLGGSVCFEPL